MTVTVGRAEAAASKPAGELREGSFVLGAAAVGQVRDGAVVEMPDSDELRALIGLRDTALALLALEADAARPDDDITATRAAAAERYRDYVARWGPLNRGELVELHGGPPDPQTGRPELRWRRPSLGGFATDPDYLAVMALEQFDPATGQASPAAILDRRVNRRPQPVTRVANAHEALAVSLGEGGIDLRRIADLLGLRQQRDAVTALGDLIFRDPERDDEWAHAREYLSGDVRAKHEAAAASGTRYRRNVEALAAVIPPDLGPLDISVALGAPWVSASDVEAFIREVIGGRVTVWHLPSAAHWRIVATGRVPAAAYTTHGTARMSAYDLISAGLNGRSPIVWDSERETGRTRRTRNIDESLAAQHKLSVLQDRFGRWVWEDADRCARLVGEYNRRFNAYTVAPYDGSGLTFPGLSDDIELWPWQRSVIERIISSPTTLCGHAVGAGKTLAMVCSAMTARRLGLATKPLIAVPAHLVEQVAREARQAYPFGRFLVAGEDPAPGRARDRLAARCATGDWDAVIVSHGLFASLPVSEQAESEWLEGRRDSLEAEVRGGRGGRYGRSELRRRIALVDKQLERLADPRRPRPGVVFETLGVDFVLLDEAHYFKRLPVISRREGMSFGSSQRASDLMLKARTLRAQRGSLPSLALFTGTPWSNTIAETFVWQSFLQPDDLAAAGVDTFDAWAAVFVDYETTVEVTPDGSALRTATRPARIRNVPELRAMFGRCADILPSSALALERPQRRDDTVVCRPSDEQRTYVGLLGARADKLRREGSKPRRGEDNMLSVCTDGRRAALDPYLVGVAGPSPKITALADRIARLHQEHADVRFAGSEVPGVLQLVFCDQGTPGIYGDQTYGRLRAALVERGIPAQRIRFIHEAAGPAARVALFAECRDGAVSVLIGSTDKVGVGTNVQARLRAVHHADAPWRPSDIEQREGRALRPGNGNAVVDVVRYVTEHTFDAYMWQTLQRKARFIEQLYRSDPGAGPIDRTLDDLGEMVLSFAEVKALATGNPVLLEQAQAAAEVSRLRTLRSVDTQSVTAARRTAEQADLDRAAAMRQETLLRAARDRLAWHETRSGDGARAGDDGGSLADVDPVAAAADELRERLLHPEPDPAPEPVRAPWRGLGVELLPAGGWRTQQPDTVAVRVTLAHRRVDEVAVPTSSLRRSAASCRSAVRRALERWVTGLDERISRIALAAVGAHDTAEDARQAIRDHRFALAADLAVAEARLAEIDTALEAAVRADAV